MSFFIMDPNLQAPLEMSIKSTLMNICEGQLLMIIERETEYDEKF